MAPAGRPRGFRRVPVRRGGPAAFPFHTHGSGIGARWDPGAPRCRPVEPMRTGNRHRALPPPAVTGTATRFHPHPRAVPEPCAPAPDPFLPPSTGTGTPFSLSAPFSRYRNPPNPNPKLGYQAGSPLPVPGPGPSFSLPYHRVPAPNPFPTPGTGIPFSLSCHSAPIAFHHIPAIGSPSSRHRSPVPPLSHRCTSGTDTPRPFGTAPLPEPLSRCCPDPSARSDPRYRYRRPLRDSPGPGAPHPLPLRSGTGQRLRVPTAPPRSGGRSPSPGAAPTGPRCPGRPLRDRDHGHPAAGSRHPQHRTVPTRPPPQSPGPSATTQVHPKVPRGRAGRGETRRQNAAPRAPPPAPVPTQGEGSEGKAGTDGLISCYINPVSCTSCSTPARGGCVCVCKAPPR